MRPPSRTITPTVMPMAQPSPAPPSPERQQPYTKEQRQEIYDKVVITSDMVIEGIPEKTIRKLIGDAVESSIVDILPPVVDRSVTIALITTRELVLKDFAYDSDPLKVMRASDLIV